MESKFSAAVVALAEFDPSTDSRGLCAAIVLSSFCLASVLST